MTDAARFETRDGGRAVLGRAVELARGAAEAPDQQKDVWFARIDGEVESVRFALAVATNSGDVGSALVLAAGFARYCDDRGLGAEGRRWLDRALAMSPDGDRTGLPLALHHAGWLAFRAGDTAAARLRFGERRAVDLAAGRSTVDALNGMGACAIRDGNYEEARELFQESLDESDGRGDYDIAFALGNLGLVAEALGDRDAAQRYREEAIEIVGARDDDTAGSEAR